MTWLQKICFNSVQELRSIGVKIRNGKAILYRGTDIPNQTVDDLRYGDFLSSVPNGHDQTGNAGADSYGKHVYRFEIPIDQIKITNGELQYIGPSKSLYGGNKYPLEIYQAYNDVHGSNYTSDEIDQFPHEEVRGVARMGLPGGADEFDRLMSRRSSVKISSPIMTDEHGQPRTFYHGTDEKFDQFERRPGKRYVLFSDFDVESPGHFFSETMEDAAGYGRNIMRRYLDVNKILLNPDEFPHLGVDRLPPDLEDELRYILEPMIKHDEKLGNWIEVGVHSYPIQDDNWIYFVIESRGLHWDALDNPEVVGRMKELGYDATYVNEDEGKSIFVVDSQQILKID